MTNGNEFVANKEDRFQLFSEYVEPWLLKKNILFVWRKNIFLQYTLTSPNRCTLSHTTNNKSKVKKGEKRKNVEERGFDPLASRMRSARSTNWATPPSNYSSQKLTLQQSYKWKPKHQPSDGSCKNHIMETQKRKTFWQYSVTPLSS